MTKGKTLQKSLFVALLVPLLTIAIVCTLYFIPSKPVLLTWENNEYSSNCQFERVFFPQTNTTMYGYNFPMIKMTTKTIFVITPTHNISTQKIDLTTMCYTLMHVPDLVWIVIEDAPRPTDLVTRLLQHCRVISVHLVVPTSAKYRIEKNKPRWSKPRGVDQRNAGLDWLRKHFNSSNCNGVFYFGDDDNKYDLRLFEEIRQTQVVSVWKVAWAGGLTWEGPTCESGKAVSWRAAFGPDREFPVDMAGFAIHLCQLFEHPQAKIGVRVNGKRSWGGLLETHFLEHFTNRSTVECRGSEMETYVWHSHTRSPELQNEDKLPSNTTVES